MIIDNTFQRRFSLSGTVPEKTQNMPADEEKRMEDVLKQSRSDGGDLRLIMSRDRNLRDLAEARSSMPEKLEGADLRACENIRQQPAADSIPPQAQKLLEERSGVVSCNGQAAPLKEGPLRKVGGAYMTVGKSDAFDVFLKEDPSTGYQYRPHFDRESFRIVSDGPARAGIRKITIQPQVDSTGGDYLPMTFTLVSAKTIRPAKFLGIFVRVGNS